MASPIDTAENGSLRDQGQKTQTKGTKYVHNTALCKAGIPLTSTMVVLKITSITHPTSTSIAPKERPLAILYMDHLPMHKVRCAVNGVNHPCWQVRELTVFPRYCAFLGNEPGYIHNSTLQSQPVMSGVSNTLVCGKCFLQFRENQVLYLFVCLCD